MSALESDTASTASMIRAYIQELRNDFNNKMSKERSSSNSGNKIRYKKWLNRIIMTRKMFTKNFYKKFTQKMHTQIVYNKKGL